LYFGRNLIEMSKEFFDNDYKVWVLGTGGCSKESTGNDTIVYLMRVSEILTLQEYFDDNRFTKKKPDIKNEIFKLGDNLKYDYNGKKFANDRLVLISKEFWYFGKCAIEIPDEFCTIQKRGRLHKCNFKNNLDKEFLSWFQYSIAVKYKAGLIGYPRTFIETRISKCKNNNESINSSCRNR